MTRVLVFIDHDIMVRHFVLSGAIEPLGAEHELTYVFPEAHKRVTVDPATLPIRRFRTVAVPPDRAYLYRRLYAATVLGRLRHTVDKGPMFEFWRQSLGRNAFWESWFYSWPLTHWFYKRRILARVGESAALNALLDEERPDLIVHPTVLEGLFVSDLVRAGQARGIPTVYLMNSWDNPAVKAMMVGHPDRLVVWGEHSASLAHERLGVPRANIVSLGAAQMDLYRRPPEEGPDEFRRRLGVEPRMPLLLYAGSSKGLDETSHLRRLEAAVESGRLPRCVVLYRPHPWRARPPGEADFFEAPWRHVVMAPDMAEAYRRSRADDRTINMADYARTHVTLAAVDAVVSPLSTILLEAALHGKPIAAYMPDEEVRSNLAVLSMARAVHFREFFERVDCIQCESPDSLVAECRRLLQMSGTPGLAERLVAQTRYFMAPTDRPYGEALTDLVREIISPRRPGDPRPGSVPPPPGLPPSAP